MNNYSKQREVILEIIKKNRIHPTAEEIYNLVIQEEPKISKSTVYRNISILVEQGTIQRITMASTPDRYDYLHENHHHAICQMCNMVFDFNYEFNFKGIEKTLKEEINQEMKVNSIVVNGICENCQSK